MATINKIRITEQLGLSDKRFIYLSFQWFSVWQPGSAERYSKGRNCHFDDDC